MRIGLSGKVLIAVLFTLGASAALLPARAATGEPGNEAATKSVTYLGHSFVVPSSWPVIKLAAGSTTCVRYDVHAVYLGAAPADQNCPAKAMGRTETLVVQPESGSVAATPFEDAASHEIDTSAPGISVTATYSSSPAQVSGILAAAGLPVPPAGGVSGGPVQRLHTNVVATGSASYSRFTGLGFDACSAPDSGTMNAWRSSSPYGAIGIYLGGVNMGCSQPNLTANWVSAQAAAGWRFFPLYVGPQAPGSSCSSCSVITSAAAQGTSAAQDAASRAANLGFGAGTPIIYDMEAYAPSGTASVLAFMAAWTNELHALGYASAEYSSLDSGISDQINAGTSAGSAMPDVVDFADWGSAPVTGDPSIPDTYWGNHQRIHQYSGGVNQTFGGYTINVDQDFLDVQGSFTSPLGGELGDVTGDGRSDLVAIAQNGDLLVYPNIGGGGTNTFGSPIQAGGGWNGYTIAAVTNPYGSGRAGLLAVAPDGTLLYYPNTGGAGMNTFGSPTQVGGGWTGYTIVAATDIHDSAGRPGLLAVAPDGTLLYYANTGGTGTGTFGPQSQVGTGWNGWTVDVADFTGDGRPDLLGVDSTGTLYLYPNTGQTSTTFGQRAQVGGGWTGWRSIDVVPHPGGGAGAPAILGVDPNGTMYKYPSAAGNGTVAFGRPTQVGSGWVSYTIA